MKSALLIIHKLFPVFVIILSGYFYGRFRKLDTKSISDLIINLTLPCLAFTLMIRTNFSFSEFITLSFAALIIPFITGFLVFIFLKLTDQGDIRGFYLPTMFMNAGNLAFSIVLFAYGIEGLTKVVIYMIPAFLMCFSLSVYIASNKLRIIEVLKQPVLYAVIIAVFFNILEFSIPNPLFQAMEFTGQITIPMLLLILGYSLNTLQISSLKFALLGSFFRIGLGFLASWIIFIHILGLRDVTGKIIVLISSMPSAFLVYPIAEKYDSNPELVSSVIVVSTLLSTVTIPLVI